MLLTGAKEVKDFDISAHQANKFKQQKTVEDKLKDARDEDDSQDNSE